ncbi:MAG: type II toxin-antitoxin system PemK/MazF family toxin [Betaproteobacteria bacterium]
MGSLTGYPRQGEVYWVSLDPVRGREMSKRRPGLIVSPDEMNAYLGTVIVAPVTSTMRPWATRYTLTLSGKSRSLALDQIRSIDAERLGKRIAAVDPAPALQILRAMFA